MSDEPTRATDRWLTEAELLGDPMPTTSMWERINEAHEWGDLPDDIEPDDHSEPDA